MPRNKESQFRVRYNDDLGEKLVWCFPLASQAGRDALKGLTVTDSVTVGYYFQLDDPTDAWVFMPADTEAAKRALLVRSVQHRIGNDLYKRLSGAHSKDNSSTDE